MLAGLDVLLACTLTLLILSVGQLPCFAVDLLVASGKWFFFQKQPPKKRKAEIQFLATVVFSRVLLPKQVTQIGQREWKFGLFVRFGDHKLLTGWRYRVCLERLLHLLQSIHNNACLCTLHWVRFKGTMIMLTREITGTREWLKFSQLWWGGVSSHPWDTASCVWKFQVVGSKKKLTKFKPLQLYT